MKRGLLINKRGLSEVITVGLIILLSISAVVIVWSFVRPSLTNIGEQITSECLTISLKATSCTAISGLTNVHNGAGETSIDEVKLIYYDATGATQVISSTCTINPLETTGCSPATVPTGAIKVDVAAVLVDGRICPEFGTTVPCTA